MIHKLLAGAASVVASDVRHYQRFHHDKAIFQVEITGTATVKLQGRCDDSAPWETIVSLSNADVDATTKSAVRSVTAMPQMRANVTAWTNGTVSAWTADSSEF